MTKLAKITSLLLSAVFMLISCKKNNTDPKLTEEGKIDIYIAGLIYKDGNYLPGYLKNNVPVVLSTDKSMSGIAVFRLVVEDDNVYAIGGINGFTGSATLMWKNGELTSVGRNYQNTYLTGIAVSNGDVYVSGAGNNPSIFNASFWKNNQEVNLNQYLQSAQDIGVHGGSAIVLGKFRADSYIPYNYGYTKNDLLFGGLKDCTNAHNLFVAGNDIYVSGGDVNGYVAYWKNEIPSSTTEKFSSWDKYRISVNKGDVYMCGMGSATVNAQVVNVIKYWKNNQPFSLNATSFEPSTRVNGHLRGIAGYNGDAYTIGEIYDQNGSPEVAFFKNTERIAINKALYFANDIFIKEK